MNQANRENTKKMIQAAVAKLTERPTYHIAYRSNYKNN